MGKILKCDTSVADVCLVKTCASQPIVFSILVNSSEVGLTNIASLADNRLSDVVDPFLSYTVSIRKPPDYCFLG